MAAAGGPSQGASSGSAWEVRHEHLVSPHQVVVLLTNSLTKGFLGGTAKRQLLQLLLYPLSGMPDREEWNSQN